MDNFTTTDMENYAKKMDEKFADKAADKADYQEFKDNFKDLVEKTFEDKGIHDVEVENRLVDKVNETYDAFTIKHTGSDVGVNISVTEAYRAYATDEADINTIANAMVNRTVEALLNAPVISEGINDIQNYDVMKNKLVMEVVSAETNAELLATVPHKDIEDMAVVYRFDVKDIVGEGATVIVTNKMLDNYGITPEQLHADAVKNAPEIRPIVIQGMAEVLAKQMGVEDMEMLGLNIPPEQEQIFVASVPDNVHGAGILAYEDFMDKASERVGNQSFFILPSSIHELLIVPDNGMMDLHSLEQMVREVNATTVDPSEKLTDNVYHYDAKDKIFELGGKFVERQEAKEKASVKEAGEKKSLLGELKAAKEEASKHSEKDVIDKGVKSKGDVAI
ncbi:MAG: hypothetical protein E7304_07970 [Butyrivibrio sp.]|uniref:DUF5688 family protein n=1 Tax=Butyrivibrio sp. TaxID=28121 RepID=UPI001EB18BDA|nr:DUF5688 family protein [Butyrivibrio sp.]MBE5841325.1 hypothetical protein [Butyrivibrio sp.]